MRIFGEQKIFPRGHHTDDLDRLAGAVLKIAANSLVRVEEAAGKLPVHNRHRWGVGFVVKAEVASRQEQGLSGVEIPRRDVEEKSIKCFVRVSEVGCLLGKDRNVRRVGEGRGMRVSGRFYSR